jgi:hypothetical protein
MKLSTALNVANRLEVVKPGGLGALSLPKTVDKASAQANVCRLFLSQE